MTRRNWTIEEKFAIVLEGLKERRALKTGFTLIELVVALVIISLIGMIAVPNHFEMRERGRQAMMIENMRCVQLACEAYATDFGGYYPKGPVQAGYGFAYYFPGGDEELQSKVGLYPKNPYTNLYMSPVDFMGYSYVAHGDNRDNRITGPNDVELVWPGMIRHGTYPFDRAREYGIVGARLDNYSIRFDGRIVVLHN